MYIPRLFWAGQLQWWGKSTNLLDEAESFRKSQGLNYKLIGTHVLDLHILSGYVQAGACLYSIFPLSSLFQIHSSNDNLAYMYRPNLRNCSWELNFALLYTDAVSRCYDEIAQADRY
jgi:hypothetical protein